METERRRCQDSCWSSNIAAASTFSPERPAPPRLKPSPPACEGPRQAWTASWKGDCSIKSQIDFVFCLQACSFESFVVYDLVASDHRPVVCHVYDVISAPARPRNRSVKGWRPRSLDDAADFKAKLNKLPSGSSVGFLEKPMVEISASIPHTTQAQRSRSFFAQELANVAEASVRTEPGGQGALG